MNKTNELTGQAIVMEAVAIRQYFIECKGSFDFRHRTLFSTHFFNKDDEEICYFIEDMKEYGLVTFKSTPRVWSDWFKDHKNYSYTKLIV